jgi:carbon monoxide dehydrogenase subunit G
MKVRGTATLHAPRDLVWDALQDPAVLVRAIPGCQSLEALGEHAYRMTLTAGVASIKGTYLGDVRLTDQTPPSSYVLRATGAGAPGTVDATATVRLTELDGTTRLEYDADAVVGGAIGGVGQRVLGGVAKKLAGEFFKAVDDHVTGRHAVPMPEPTARQPREEEVFTRSSAETGVRTAGSSDERLRWLVAGSVIALAGVLVGARIARRS